MTINTKPMTSSPRRGRINFQTSGNTAFSLSIFGGLAASFDGELNLLLDSVSPVLASLLLHCHTSTPTSLPLSSGRQDCDTPPSAVVCSGRVPPFFAGPFTYDRPRPGPADHPFSGPGIFRLYHLATERPSKTADQSRRPQPQGLSSVTPNSERP